MGQPSFETLEVYQLAERLAAEVWNIVMCWPHFAKDTIGKQLVRAADSVGANLAEGYGRGSHADNKRFIYIARGSLNETVCWLKRGTQRTLFTSEESDRLAKITDELSPRLSSYLNYVIRQAKTQTTRGETPQT